jgi:transcriptional regulator with XRE-family HTH domain
MTKEKLRQIRQEKGLSQEAMADILGIGYRTLQRWEYGQTAIRLSEVQVRARLLEHLEGKRITLQRLK